ncbi:hypothetical protein NDU88_008236 [Pleurodeles waltl]|uniref:Uncharacterized protein n=1 Tax=Pleurodeles waltl TaxID=8319 RepID=A0AAV7RSK6_PLEWA|nr:hypothetical protein NDU88_008236 [Pleurodeles waltl]
MKAAAVPRALQASKAGKILPGSGDRASCATRPRPQITLLRLEEQTGHQHPGGPRFSARRDLGHRSADPGLRAQEQAISKGEKRLKAAPCEHHKDKHTCPIAKEPW